MATPRWSAWTAPACHVAPRRARRSGRLLALGPPPAQPALHEPVEVAVEHGADVARLHVGAQVLDHLVRLQHVRADLAAPADLGLLAADGVELVGWIGNDIDPAMAAADDNFAILQARLRAPCWGRLAWQARPDAAAQVACLRLPGAWATTNGTGAGPVAP